jgi:hypothetical protein
MSVDFIRELKPDVVSVNIASPILGSKLRDECIANGWIKTAELGRYNRMTPMIENPECSTEHILAWFNKINREINFTHNYRMETGDFKTAKLYFEYVTRKHPHEDLAWHYLDICNKKLSEL